MAQTQHFPTGDNLNYQQGGQQYNPANQTVQFGQNGCPDPGQGYQQGGYQQANQGYQQSQQSYQGYQQGGYQQGYQQPPQNPYNSYAPYEETTTNNAFNCGPEGKCRGIYSILALIGGSLGLHYFYINKIGAAILTIALVLITCGAYAIVPVIQGILGFWILTNEDFHRKFIASDSFLPMF